MAIHLQPIDAFLELAATHPILDVRSPGEYVHAHIPGAHSLPLFSDTERAAIGTAYKQDSREAAIMIGLDAFGPKMRTIVKKAAAVVTASTKSSDPNSAGAVLVHCWRGGMRSEAVAWLLSFYGFEVHLLTGGYKAYRHWVIDHWMEDKEFCILGGNTGSGKTRVLTALREGGEPVLDLEGLANHKGSAFGGLDNIPQPSQEMFENFIAMGLQQLHEKFEGKPIWIEDESQRIGDVNIPHIFYKKLGTAPKVFLDVNFEERLDNIVKEYGNYPLEGLINAIVRIKKRLGPLETKTAIAHLVEGDARECFRVLLQYYDKHYYPAGHADNHIIIGSGKTPQQIATLIKTSFP